MPVSLLLALIAAQPTVLPRVVEPAATNDVLFNPFMGVYLQYPPLDARPDEWFMQLADIAYYRLDWAEVNPEPGVYRFDEVFGPWFDFWVGRCHKRVALRVMSQSMHSQREYVTPKWVFDAGVPGVDHVGLVAEHQVDPAFWDETYLDLQAEFVAALGDWLDGRPGFEFVDIGGIGEWGEMHLARWTPDDLDATGYTDAGYVAAYRRMIDAYADAFRQTPVFLNVGGPNRLCIDDYAALRGANFRQDGLQPDGASYHVERWLYPDYARRGTLCNFEFHSGWTEMQDKGWDVRATIEAGLSAPICYLNSNLFGGNGYRAAPPEAREALMSAARRLGYRFVITRVELPAEGHVSATLPGRLVFGSHWRNDGVAWSRGSYAVTWELVGADGKVASRTLDYPQTPTTRWDPGATVDLSHRLDLPPGTAPGRYRLRAGMVEPETGRDIQLGIEGRTADGMYDLTEVELTPSQAAGGEVWHEDFEGGAVAGWKASDGLSLSLDDGHDGGHALRVQGTCGRTWNYVGLRLPVPLLPAARYRLTGWLRADKVEGARAPYLKIGVNGADGRWIDNYNTGPCDLRQPGAWQRLSRTFEVPLTGATGDLTIERGALEGESTVDLRLDDLRLELLDAP